MKKVTFLALLLAGSVAFAQETTLATTFAGSADGYYKYDLSKNPNQSVTSFTGVNDSFELGMASIEATHKMGKGSVFVDLGFGNRASEFTYNDKEDTFMIKQLNFTYDVSSKLKITMGSFGTHLGFELVDAVDNKNYSMSYAFTNGPFFNTGAKAQYTSGKFSFMAGITNPTDFKSAVDAEGSKNKTFIGQVGYVVDSGSAYFNVTSGSSNRFSTKNVSQFDLVATKKVNDKFTLGFNGTYASVTDDTDSKLDGSWFSAIGYVNYAVKPNLLLAYRLEYFDDKDALSTNALGTNVIGETLSLNYKTGNLTIIPEIRYDLANKKVFASENASVSKTNAYLLLATTYSF